MPDYTAVTSPAISQQDPPTLNVIPGIGGQDSSSSTSLLPEAITRAASKQTYYTIRFLVDRDRVHDAFQAYAYFRWLDDCLDEKLSVKSERLAFVQRQQALTNSCCRGERVHDVTEEENLLLDLIRVDSVPSSGLQLYIRNMFAVMAFDAERRGRVISEVELRQYSRNLSVAVTEALHYFIGHDDPAPKIRTRYSAVTGAHITHMLRDTFEDVAAGYFNIPREFLSAHRLDPCDVTSDSYKVWVKNRTQLARSRFKVGNDYLAQVKNLRCRIAGHAYTARFEQVLNAIEREGFQLRPAYLERKTLSGGLKMTGSILSILLKELVHRTS